MKRLQPCMISKDFVRHLLDNGIVLYDPENRRAVWFGTVLTFSEAQNICFQVLWKNFLQGNLPLPQERVISGWAGRSTHVSFLLKRHTAWTTGIIVGDGRGNLWLDVARQSPESPVQLRTEYQGLNRGTGLFGREPGVNPL